MSAPTALGDVDATFHAHLHGEQELVMSEHLEPGTPRRSRGHRPWVVVAAVTGVIALVASGCGGGGDETGGNGSGDDPGAPVQGGELVYGLEAETTGAGAFPRRISPSRASWLPRRSTTR
ncbi:MAG: hypothetical protein M5U19_11285 [Microthrixaceae bacterium]|nr:hypothetical protein [Microthrixaceae bacterium]